MDMSRRPAAGDEALPGAIPLAAPQPIYRYHAYQGDTNNCGPYSVAIAANAYLGEARCDPLAVAGTMNALLFKARPLPHWVLVRLRNGPSFPWGMAAYLVERLGVPARCRAWCPEDLLCGNLASGLITIVFIGDLLRCERGRYRGWAHAKVLYGSDPERGYAFVDPGYERDALDPWAARGIFWQTREAFLAGWRGMLRTAITVGVQSAEGSSGGSVAFTRPPEPLAPGRGARPAAPGWRATGSRWKR
ncbi:MAG TPA: hypothetical protein PLJ35_00910 [Anaerolineae bacterium]|nr:hypothetical protein [Anaerolineae bacterium]HOQ97306.1 hypothetical protein [Anaerolineae bacterium]HOQ97363.1 hypothetical protein [Anaerolineae bacterium]HPL27544.1 hypothetical protein [Anaerolineae bacterium]